MLPDHNNYSTIGKTNKRYNKNNKYVEDEGQIYTYGGQKYNNYEL